MQRRGGRKLVLAPDSTLTLPTKPNSAPSTLLKALARAYRWQHILESGSYGSIAELSAAETINQSYVCRLLRLTLLAPDIAESILDGRHNTNITLDYLTKPTVLEWQAQRLEF